MFEEIVCFVLFCFVSFCTEVQGWYANGTLSPMRGISPSLYPPMPRDSQRTATTPGTSCPALFRIVCGLFNVPQWTYIIMEGICETGATVYRPHLRIRSLNCCHGNTECFLMPEHSNFNYKMMLKLKNSKPYFSIPITHCNLRLAPNVQLLP